MDNRSQKLAEPCLLHMGFHPCPCKAHLNPEGFCYAPPADLGEGYYWYYEQEGLFTVAFMDLQLHKDQILEYQQPDYISISCYDTISADELSPLQEPFASYIRGHVSRGELFRAKYYKNTPIRGMELMLMPGYYNEYLEQKYSGEFPDPKAAFLSINGTTNFPELALLMHQIRAFQGTGTSAHLFYESKVAEAVSLIVEKTKDQAIPEHHLSDDDLSHLDEVHSYIEEHYVLDLHTSQLAKIACMGQTKLRSSFKKYYGYTITEFIRQTRIRQAESLLVRTDWSIQQIAESVGYHHSGRFAGLFHETTGLYPEEYRHTMKK